MKKRIISAIIALIIIIPLLIIGNYPFILGCSIISILGYKEIIELKKSHHKIPNLITIIGLIDLLILVLNNIKGNSFNYVISYQSLLFVIISLLLPTIFYKKEEYITKDAFYLIGNILLIGLFFNSLIILRYKDFSLLIYLILIPILTDTFAYFGGKLFGKHKLSSISPNKTWEGSIIGLGLASILGIIYYLIWVGSFSFKVIWLTILLSSLGQMGDLFMSKIKRENDIKDFSNIMPGHGGILDRLDSLIFVIFSYIILMYL